MKIEYIYRRVISTGEVITATYSTAQAILNELCQLAAMSAEGTDGVLTQGEYFFSGRNLGHHYTVEVHNHEDDRAEMIFTLYTEVFYDVEELEEVEEVVGLEELEEPAVAG